MSKSILTQKRLKEVLSYDKETGLFIRLIATALRNKVGEEAGYIDKSTGYRRITIDSQKHYAHRLVFLYVDGALPKTVDHDNKIKTDNRYLNLSNTTQAENCKNKVLLIGNKFGINGITYKHSKYYVRIGKKHKPILLGCFTNFFEACCVRKSAENKYGYHKNHGIR